MKHRWFEKDGHVFSEEVKLKNNKEFRQGGNFDVRTAIAFNVGGTIGRHIAQLHNQNLEKKDVDFS